VLVLVRRGEIIVSVTRVRVRKEKGRGPPKDVFVRRARVREAGEEKTCP